MRIDKFMKVSRLIKRRTIAKKVCDQGRVTINGSVAKAGSIVKAGDTLVVRFGQKLVTVEIDHIREVVRKDDASSMYTIVSEDPVNE